MAEDTRYNSADNPEHHRPPVLFLLFTGIALQKRGLRRLAVGLSSREPSRGE
jgi:hypothetical protein